MSKISKYLRPSCLLFAIAVAPSMANAQDADGDGVSDSLDAAPCDANADGMAYAPGLDQSTMMLWEDLWPTVGDTDFNDLVFSVNYTFRMQGAQVSSVRLTLGVLAVGSDYNNGFGLHLPVNRSLVQSVVRTVDGLSPTDLPLDADSELTFVISNNAREFFSGQAGAINSVGPGLKAPSVEVEIVFSQPVTLDLALAPFDPFLFRSADRGHEVHGADYPGTASMNAGLFGAGDDGSAGSRYFVSNAGLPFVLSMPQVAAYPSEFTDIAQLYPDILAFAASGGTTNADYYLTNVDMASSYANQPAAPAITTAIDFSCLPRSGVSCRDILDSGNSSGDGVYIIDPDGPLGRAPIEVYCDMTTDGGGWIVIHDDIYANARQPQGQPSAMTGWSVDYLSATSVLSGLAIEDFEISIPGVWSKTFRDVAAYNSSRRLSPTDLFSGTHRDGWQCNSDAPGAAVCDFTTGDGRNWGLWESTGACCIGQATGGLWFYSQSTQGTENYGICGDGYPNGTGYVGAASGCSGGTNYTPVNPMGQQRFVLKIREAARAPTLNMPSAARATCRTILDLGEAQGSGEYWIDGPNGAPIRAHCDMVTDGGGWTTFFAGRNGSINVFDHFDSVSFEGICTDASTRCMRRMPTTISMANTEFAIVHGASVLAAPLTSPTYGYFTQGTQAGWVSIAAADMGTGPVNVGANTFWTGSAANDGWIAAANQSQGAVFASHYDYGSTWNTGNGQPDTSTVIRLMFREGGRPAQTALNVPASARSSCRAILDLGEAQGSGIYWISPSGSPYEAYCDMVTDGGGWTAFVAGYNGSANTFDHMEAGYHSGICTDAGRRCMRRMPASIPQALTEMAVSIGPEMVAMPFNGALYNWAVSGTQSGWTNVGSVLLTTDVRAQPTSFWTGSGANRSWISARNQSGGGSVFAAQYNYNSSWDYGNGAANTWSPVRIFYREGGIPRAPNAHVSCVAALAAGNTADGVYTIQALGGRARQAYCDMTHDGGGWEAILSGVNGSPNTFDHFESAYYSGICTDPATRCLRHLPAQASVNTEMALACGNAMVAFSMNTAVYNFFRQGSQAAWQGVSAVRDIGTSPVVYLPDSLWTGSSSNSSFILTQGQASARMLGGNYNYNASWNYCNSSPDTSSVLRVFFR